MRHARARITAWAADSKGMRILRWASLVILGAGWFTDDPDDWRHIAFAGLALSGIVWLEVKDGRTAKRGGLRIIASRCAVHEQAEVNRDAIAELQADSEGLRATQDQLFIALSAAGMVDRRPRLHAVHALPLRRPDSA